MWFLSKFNRDFQLDVVGFLAILGEGAVLSTAQVLGASNVSYIPRLIPAPQALFRAKRPSSLPIYNAQVSAIHSGNARSHIHYIAHLLLDRDFAPYTVRCVDVKKDPDHKRDLVKVRNTGPISWVTLLGCLSSIILLVTSAVLHDGMSLIATVVLSLVATLAGYANKWDMRLPKRGSANTEIPDGDLVVRYPNGSFLVVRCSEEVARELYFAPEEITYRQSRLTYQMVSLIGTSMLMVGVICLANATEVLQVMWAGLFILLNAAYWLIAALPSQQHWNLSCYIVLEHAIQGGQCNPSYTEALWKAIALTKSTEWAEICQPARPQTKCWKTWMERAQTKGLEASWKKESSPQEQDLIWPYSGRLYDIPRWNAHKALVESDGSRSITQNTE